MSEMEDKLGAILSNPQLMQQIMAMAQTLGGGQSQKEEPQKQQKKPEPESSGLPDFDPKMLQNLSGILRQNGVDQNQQALLRALSPYLSRDRVGKLERAMRAARIAGAASTFLNAGGLQLLTGR